MSAIGSDPRVHLRRAIIPLLPQLSEDVTNTAHLPNRLVNRGGYLFETEDPKEGFQLSKPDEDVELPDLEDVQGDVIYLFPKKAEDFVFFRIANVTAFKDALGRFQPSSSLDVAQFVMKLAKKKGKAGPFRNIPFITKYDYQIAFSRMGLYRLGVKGDIGDTRFDTYAMRDNKIFLDDQSDWDEIFDKCHPDPVNGSVNDDEGALHGVITVAASDDLTCTEATDAVKRRFGSSIEIGDGGVVRGRARPRENNGHEHFGYKDGISQPALRHLTIPKPGQIQVNPGVIVMGYKGDPVVDDPNTAASRPPWAKGGTMMVFRKLEQDVPEFHTWKKQVGVRWREFAPPKCPTLTDDQGADLWGARMIGRWQSGAPLALCPYMDDPKLAGDDQRNNDFDYHVKDVSVVSPKKLSDYYCPYTAHTRKTVPRNLDPYIQRRYLEAGMIVRAGLPYGDEVTDEEAQSGVSDRAHKRGLLFVCYQSSLDDGFVRQSVEYAGNLYFPTTSLIPEYHGTDPIIGSNPPKGSVPDPREVAFVEPPGAEPQPGDEINLVVKWNEDKISVSGSARVQKAGAADPPGVPQQFFVTSRGGEYFFVPPISTLKAWAAGNV
ncbi:unnamed protein product [Peniophora sp. CBMAI 1063]|nr:unnamed protein product [Peniophora sp. CBMAI 1063]